MLKLSRRTLVSGAAALPALTVPALADVIDHPDAELLRLAAELDPIEQERARGIAQFHKQCAIIHAEVERRTGIARCDAPEVTYPETGYWAVEREVSKMVFGSDHAYDEDESGKSAMATLLDRLYPVLDEILSRKAATVKGLKIQTRAAAIAAMDLWDGNPRGQTRKAIHRGRVRLLRHGCETDRVGPVGAFHP